jgi:hypothetical protein
VALQRSKKAFAAILKRIVDPLSFEESCFVSERNSHKLVAILVLLQSSMLDPVLTLIVDRFSFSKSVHRMNN